MAETVIAQVHAGIEPTPQYSDARIDLVAHEQFVFVDEAGGEDMMLAQGGKKAPGVCLRGGYAQAFADNGKIIDSDGDAIGVRRHCAGRGEP